MNEQRIRELAEQVVCFEQDMDGSMEPNEDGQWIRVDELEKFAELIVGECVGIVEQYGTPDAFYIVDEINRVMLNIRPNKHFGVEE